MDNGAKAKMKHIKDYSNIVTLVLMFTLVLGSFIYSDYFPKNLSMTGFSIVMLGNINSDAGYLPTAYSEPYANVPVLFYINLTNASTGDPMPFASCTVEISTLVTADMSYQGTSKRYEYSYVFSQQGSYTYSISCNASIYGEDTVTETGTITVNAPVPDFIISISANDSSINTDTTIVLNISNIGLGTYTGNIAYDINYGDSTSSTAQLAAYSQNNTVITLTHTYSASGNYTISAEINSNVIVTETNYTNNFATAIITLNDPSVQEMTCGRLDSSVSMSSDIYCEGNNIFFGRSNITVDCNNHRIYGSGTENGRGIYIGTSNITIKNCVIDNYAIGIEIDQNAEVVLSNNTMRSTKIGVLINSSYVNLTKNNFTNNVLALQNFKQQKINYNDFTLNTYNLNTTVSVDFTRNYFASTSSSEIIGKIKNNSLVVLVTPILNESARSSSASTEDFDFTPPTATFNITQEINNDYSTSVIIVANTSERSACKYGTTNSSYDEMTLLSTSDSLSHTYDAIFTEYQKVKIYVRCRDLNGNEAPIYTSSEFSIRSLPDLAVEELNSKKSTYETKKTEFLTKKQFYQTQLSQATTPEDKSQIQGDIDRSSIESDYYFYLILNINDIITQLNSIDNSTRNLKDSYLTPYYDSYTRTISEINSTIQNITVSLASESDKITKYMETYLDKKETLLGTFQKNLSKRIEYNDVLNDHLVPMLTLENSNLKAEKDRWTKLEKVDKSNYSSKISDIVSDISNKEEEILDSKDNETLNDFDIKIDATEANITFINNYIDDLENATTKLETAITYSQKNNKYATAQELLKLKEDVTGLIESLEFKVKMLEDLSDTLEESRFEFKGHESIINTTNDTSSSSYRITIDSNITNNTIVEVINRQDMSISRVVIFLNSTNTSASFVDLTKYNLNPFNDPENTTTFEWYMISKSAWLEMTSIEVYLQIDITEMAGFNTTPQKIKLLRPNSMSTWEVANSTYVQRNATTYEYRTTLAGIGSFAVGYVNTSKNVSINATPDCISEWICEEFTKCDDAGMKTRKCSDIKNCTLGNNTRTDIEACKVSCNDNIKNQDEEDVDCGGSCPNACVDFEQPIQENETMFPDDNEDEKQGIFPMILTSLIIISIAGLATEGWMKLRGSKYMIKLKSKMGIKQKAETAYTFDFDLIDLITESVFAYDTTEKTLQKCIIRGANKQFSEYMLQLVRFIFGKLQSKVPQASIIEDLVKSRWYPEDAAAVVKHIIISYLVNQIKEYFSISEHNEEEEAVIRDIFINDGFEQEMIDKAFTEYELTRNK